MLFTVICPASSPSISEEVVFSPSIVPGELKSLERINPGGDTYSSAYPDLRLESRSSSAGTTVTMPKSARSTRVASCTLRSLPHQTRCRALELGVPPDTVIEGMSPTRTRSHRRSADCHFQWTKIRGRTVQLFLDGGKNSLHSWRPSPS